MPNGIYRCHEVCGCLLGGWVLVTGREGGPPAERHFLFGADAAREQKRLAKTAQKV